jgi:hypothetical protein
MPNGACREGRREWNEETAWCWMWLSWRLEEGQREGGRERLDEDEININHIIIVKFNSINITVAFYSKRTRLQVFKLRPPL